MIYMMSYLMISKQIYSFHYQKSLLMRQRSRKLVRPWVYGKTKHSATTDILKALDFTLSKGDGYKLAEAFYIYRERKFPTINQIMKIVNEVGWITG